MSLVVTIGTLIAETAAAVLAFACFCLLYREFYRRKSLHLLFFSLFFLVLGVAFGSFFLTQLAYADVYLSLANIFQGLATYLLTLAPFLLLEGLSQAYGGKLASWRSLVNALAGSTFLILLTTWLDSGTMAVFPSISAIGPGWKFHLLTLISWAIAFFSLVIFYFIYRQSSGAKRLVAYAIISFTAIFAVVALAIIGQHTGIISAIFILALIFMAMVAFVGAASGHPDEEVSENPIRLIRRSLTFKAVIFNVAIFWALSFLVISVAVFHFVTTDINNKRSSARNNATRLAGCIAIDQEDTLQAVRLFALPPRVMPSKVDRIGWRPGGLDSLLAITGSQVVRLLDAGGKVIYSSFSPEEIGLDMGSLESVRGALSGHPTTRLGNDSYFDFPVLLSSSSIALDDQTQGVLLVSRESSFCEKSIANVAVVPTGSGLIDRNGVSVVVAGKALTSEQLNLLTSNGNPKSEILSEDSGGILAIEPIKDTNGQIVALAYVYLSPVLLLSSSIRLAAVIILMVLAALILMTIVLIYSLTHLIRPIKQLQKAVDVVESGDYSQRLDNESPDELGRLVRAFNKMSQTIGEQTDSLRRKMREQADFLINTAYEMRTPLNVFSWTVDMMRFGDTGRMNKGQLELVEQLRQTTDRLSGLVQNLLDAAEMDRGGLTIQAENFQVADILDTAIGDVSVKAKDKKVELVWSRPDAVPVVNGDAKRTRQIFNNLISNALKYTHKGGRVAFKIRTVKKRSPKGSKGKYLQISIEDNGFGIPKDEQERVFSRFFRARNAVASDIEGAGLGLFIVKRLVEMQGGSIWFKSTEEVGSAFSFTLPIVETEEEDNI